MPDLAGYAAAAAEHGRSRVAGRNAATAAAHAHAAALLGRLLPPAHALLARCGGSTVACFCMHTEMLNTTGSCTLTLSLYREVLRCMLRLARMPRLPGALEGEWPLLKYRTGCTHSIQPAGKSCSDPHL